MENEETFYIMNNTMVRHQDFYEVFLRFMKYNDIWRGTYTFQLVFTGLLSPLLLSLTVGKHRGKDSI